MKEYIVPIYDDSPNHDEIFVGYIREHATEIVRCKDCKYWERQEVGGRCVLNIRLGTSHNWFCADGRKENASE